MSAPVPETPAPPPDARASLRARASEWLSGLLRDPNPILLKELRATFRTALFIRFLYLTTGLVGLMVLTWGAVMAGERAPAEVGQEVFHVFFSIVIVVIAMVAPSYAATTITGEKRSGTFESLILSGMSPARIVWGKFVACYGAIVLCIIAVAPVVGLAFLFGGISPLAVLTGFAYVLLALAPAVAFGLSISARVESMWLAIVIAFFTYMAGSMFFVWPAVVGLGSAAQSAWGTPFEGPFWFAEALPERAMTWDGWAFLVLVPLYVFGMPVWFFIASAIAGVQPPAEDRSTPLKIWTVPAIGGAGIIAACIVSVASSNNECAEIGVALSIASGWLMLFICLLFADEPPLPPRSHGSRSLLARALSVIGPGAGPTLRFTFLAVVASAAVVPVAVSIVRWLRAPEWGDHLRYDSALFAIAAGNAAIGLFVAAMASGLRLLLRNGLAARVLSLAVISAAVLLPVLASLVLDDDALGNMTREVPLPMMVSPLLPTILGFGIVERHGLSHWEALRVGVTIVGYGLLAMAGWAAVEARCVQARRAMAARKSQWIARSVAENAPAPAAASADESQPSPEQPSSEQPSPAEPEDEQPAEGP